MFFENLYLTPIDEVDVRPRPKIAFGSGAINNGLFYRALAGQDTAQGAKAAAR